MVVRDGDGNILGDPEEIISMRRGERNWYEDEITRLRAALEKYGRHKIECALVQDTSSFPNEGQTKCTCGLDAAPRVSMPDA